MKHWETLLARALFVLDSAASAGTPVKAWTFGGGSALAWRHRHRSSSDVEILLRDPETLGRVSPQLNSAVEALTSDYVEEAHFLRLCFPEGNLDFVVSGPLTPTPFTEETILGRPIRVETPAEIVAKRVRHRAASFTARDLFDLAFVADRVPGTLPRIQGVLALRREALLQRLKDHEEALREDFEALDPLDFRPSFDDCATTVRALLARVADSGTPRAEQEPARYRTAGRLAVQP